jgi:hypothetical protein
VVLGRPGSGCSTFLKVLSDQTAEYHAVEGDVWYDSFTPEEIAKQYRGDVIYCPEDDVHFPSKAEWSILGLQKRRGNILWIWGMNLTTDQRRLVFLFPVRTGVMRPCHNLKFSSHGSKCEEHPCGV